MDHPTVGVLVQGLGAAFESGLDSYATWMERQQTRNHYRRRSPGSATPAAKCALGASFDISNHRIKATYQVASAIVGLEFAVGDETCRSCLAANLRLLEERVGQLIEGLAAAQVRHVDLGTALRTSESVRIQCISALAEQYRRFSVGRALPPELPIPKPRVALLATDQPPHPASRPSPTATSHQGCDQATVAWSCSSDPPAISEPPSPPPTPKTILDHAPESVVGNSGGLQNSVFSIFCSQAMALQVDPGLVPSRFRRPCACGFRWDFPELAPGVDSVPLKPGFRLTRRFLAKSHCGPRSQVCQNGSPGANQHGHGYGCVFCTSTGRTDAYGTIEDLRSHIDSSHTKWQMLHDHDMA